ncbi:MAG: GGDEF domain-containing protein [Rhodospirillales bacterium]|nr:GGDEF domain-containing protein [Rhodospirillales bacterium]
MLRQVFGGDFGRSMAALGLPVGLLLICYPVLMHLDQGSWALRTVAPYLTYAVFAAALILALWFHCSRAVFVLLLLALGHWMAVALLPGGADQGVNGRVVYAAYSVLLPINVVAFSIFRERGLLSERGFARLAVVGLQVGIVAAVAVGDYWLDAASTKAVQGFLAEALRFRLLPHEYDSWTPLPQPAVLLFAVALIFLIIRALWRGATPLAGGFAGALAAAFLALHLVGKGHGATVFFAAAGLAMIFALIQESYRMAFLDELTGLPGRRALLTELDRLGGRYTLTMLDVDHFKKFNDTYGHDVGDQVLRMVATRMMMVTGGGKAFRYGGEEFTVVFPNKNKEDAYRHLEALRKAIQASSFTLRDKDRPEEKPSKVTKKGKAGGKKVSVTVSMGVGEPDEERATPVDVMKLADEALYRAKEGGRNRISA